MSPYTESTSTVLACPTTALVHHVSRRFAISMTPYVEYSAVANARIAKNRLDLLAWVQSNSSGWDLMGLPKCAIGNYACTVKSVGFLAEPEARKGGEDALRHGAQYKPDASSAGAREATASESLPESKMSNTYGNIYCCTQVTLYVCFAGVYSM